MNLVKKIEILRMNNINSKTLCYLIRLICRDSRKNNENNKDSQMGQFIKKLFLKT
jgi:hypothetical protein